MLLISPTDRHALRLLADRLTPTEIGARLGMAPGEIEHYLITLFTAMGVSSPSEAVASAGRRGLLRHQN